MKIILPALLLLSFAVEPLAGTYKWVDKDGNVHYSDQPAEGAEEVQLPETSTFDAPAVQPRPPVREERDEEQEQLADYDRFEFISPKQDQVFWAAAGTIPVQLSLAPALRGRHAINLYLNGELTESSPMRGLGATLEEVYRGAHTVRAVVVGEDGEELISTEPVTFHVKQRSIANPQRRSGQ